MLPKDTYFEFSLTASGRSVYSTAAVQLVFSLAKIEEARQVQSEFRSRKRWSFYTRSEKELRHVSRVVAQLKPAGLKAAVKTLGPKDWRDRWQLYFHTMPFGRRFAVVPVWEKKRAKPQAARISLFLDPCGAFGSGGHETTRLMVRMMETLQGKFRSFSDIGTGTGILAVAARHLGADRLEAIDIEAASVRAARRNFRLNGQRGGNFKAADIRHMPPARYDLVAANFISADLIACRKAILARVRPGGYLIVSGISRRNLKHFETHFAVSGLTRIQKLLGRSWAGLIYRKNT